MTRLRLTTPTGRAAVGYDPDLTTYYLELGPPATGTEGAADPDEGLIAFRGRIPDDLPHLVELLAELNRRAIALTPAQHQQLVAAAPASQVIQSRRYRMPPRRSARDRPAM